MQHAVYILNRVTTKALNTSAPHEVWTRRKPRLEHLRMSGYTAHMKVPAAHIKKLDDHSIPMVYLGVEAGSKAHRLFDPRSGKICISYDVTFKENRSWNWSKAATSDHNV